MVQESLGREPFVWAKGSLCVHHRIPFDAKLLFRHFLPPYNLASLQQAPLVYDSKVAMQKYPVQDIYPAVFPAHAVLMPKEQGNLGQYTAELFAQTINKLKGKVTILFITHQLPKGLAVDEAILLGKETTTKNQVNTNGEEKVETWKNQKFGRNSQINGVWANPILADTPK